jgi:hypothetical protein
MRILNEIEKELCRRILEGVGPNNFLGNIIYNKLNGVCIHVDIEQKQSHLIFTIYNNIEEEQTSILNRIQSLSYYILQTVNLIELLEREGYILLLERSINSQEPTTFGGCVQNLPRITHNFVDQNVIDLICKYSNKEIYITEEFERFCKKNFLARDEQRFQRQTTFTLIAITIAIIALIFNIYINFFNEKANQEFSIDSKQFKILLDKINQQY